MNWGNKLLLVFACFAVLMSTLVYKCMHQKFDLVSKDYYTDELRYQDKIDGINNANKISSVSVKASGNTIAIQLPKEVQGLATTGQVWLYCVTDDLKDKKVNLHVNDAGLMLINKSLLAPSKYQVKLNWQIGKDKYYSEQNLTINL